MFDGYSVMIDLRCVNCGFRRAIYEIKDAPLTDEEKVKGRRRGPEGQHRPAKTDKRRQSGFRNDTTIF